MDTSLYQRIGRRIKQARETLGLTQEDLARAISRVTEQPMSATKISYFETGARRLRLEDLPVFAKALGKSPDYFLSETELIPNTDTYFRTVLFRATRALNPYARQQIEQEVDLILHSQVKQGYVLPLVPRRTPSEILRILHITKPVVDPVAVAYSSGIVVESKDLDDSVTGLIVLTEGHKAIIVNKKVGEGFPFRFAVAHELGHCWLGHYPDVEMNVNLSQPYQAAAADTVIERQADWFASELLMPEEWLGEHWKECDKDIKRMSDLYQVTVQAMWNRLMGTGMVKDLPVH